MVVQVRASSYWLLRDDQTILVFIILFALSTATAGSMMKKKQNILVQIIGKIYIALANATGDPKPHKVFYIHVAALLFNINM